MRRWLVIAGLVGIVAAFLVSIWFDPNTPDRGTSTFGDSGPHLSSHDVMTATLLAEQTSAVTSRDRAGYLAGWAPGTVARRDASTSYDNLGRLHVTAFRALVDGSAVDGLGSRWRVGVDVTWGFAHDEAGLVTSHLVYGFVERSGRALITSIAPAAGNREPIWLLAGLQVETGPRTLVAGTNRADVVRAERLLRTAVTQVGAVLPHWSGRLIVYVPSSLREFDELVSARPADFRGIAAVTTTIAGTVNADGQDAIVLIPSAFGSMGPVSAQIVMTHEAVHAATHNAASTMPTWVAEGFADYVAFHAAGLPAPVVAQAALEQVTADGVPSSLPSDADFVVGSGDLEATYERAWVATALIASMYHQARLVAFYHYLQAHPAQEDSAFQQVLHTTKQAFTARWQARLRELAAT